MTRAMQSVANRAAWRQWFEGTAVQERPCHRCDRVPDGLIQIIAWADSGGVRYATALCPQHRQEILPAGVVDERLDVVAVSGRLDEDRRVRGVSVDYLSPPVEGAPTRTDAGAISYE